MLSRAVIALGTKRLSRSITFVIAFCSCGSRRPAATPASTVATISSFVIFSFDVVGNPQTRIMKPDIVVKTQTRGLNTKMNSCIKRTIPTAIVSGRLIATRFGIRSANITKSKVTKTNEQAKETEVNTSCGRNPLNSSSNTPVNAASPRMPPKMATALIPI